VAKEADGIEVTEEMIEAGVEALGAGTLEGLDDDSVEKSLRQNVERVYRAMAQLNLQRDLDR
jgi:hypothetical protein